MDKQELIRRLRAIPSDATFVATMSSDGDFMTQHDLEIRSESAKAKHSVMSCLDDENEYGVSNLVYFVLNHAWEIAGLLESD